MNKKKIVKTSNNAAQISSNVVFIKAQASKSKLKPINALCEGLLSRTKLPQVYVIGSSQADWEAIVDETSLLKQCLSKNIIAFAKNQNEVDLEEKHNLFFMPLKYGRTSDSYAKILVKLAEINSSENALFALGKNTGKKQNLGGKVFGAIANAWARILHGINAKNIASDIIGFSAQKYKALVLKYGENSTPLLLLKQSIEEGETLHCIDGDFGDPAYGFGAGLMAIIQSKLMVTKALPQRFFKIPLKEIKANGIQLTEKNSPFYKLSFFVASILIFLVMLFTATDYNVTWDEPGHLQYSEHVLDYYTSLGDDTTIFNNDPSIKKDYLANYVYYGGSVDLVAEIIQTILPGEVQIYYVRRYLNGAIGFIMLLIIALLARYLFGWRAALIALLAAFLSPSFYGHFFNNHKDIPFALGYIMTAYYLIRLIGEMPKPKFQTMFMLALGVGFSLSIRATGLAQFGFVFAFLGLHWLLNAKDKAKSFLRYIFIFLGVSIVAYIIGILLWPFALRDPINGPLNAFKEFSNFTGLHYMELFEGVRLFNKPWHYEPKLILITAPLMAILGWALFVLTALIKPNKKRTFALVIILLMTFAPTAYTIYKGSYLYNGWRHFLFIYPTLIVLAVWGYEKLMELLKGIKVAKLTVPILSILLLIPALLFNLKNHPYQYMYFNELVGGVEGAAGNYELDYWSQSSREAFNWMKENIPEAKSKKLRYATNNIKPTCEGMDEGGDSFTHVWCREMQWYDKAADYNLFTTRTLSKSQILNGNWPPAGTIHEIKVDGVTVAAVAKKQNNYGSEAYYLMKANKVNEAYQKYKIAHEANPKEEEYVRGMAMTFKAKQNWDSAILLFKKAAEIKDHNYQAFNALGECYLNKATQLNPQQPDPNLIAEAKKYFKLTTQFKSNYSSAYYYLGALAQNEKRDKEAISYFNQTIKQSPNAIYGYNAIAKSFDNVGKLDSAIWAYSASIQISESQKRPDAQVYGLLAQLFQKKGDTKTAQQLLQRYQQLIGGAAAP